MVPDPAKLTALPRSNEWEELCFFTPSPSLSEHGLRLPCLFLVFLYWMPQSDRRLE